MTTRALTFLALALALARCESGDPAPKPPAPAVEATVLADTAAVVALADTAGAAVPDTSAVVGTKRAPEAAAPASGPGVYVLVVAIDDYPGADDDLESTRADAGLIGRALAERLDVPAAHVRTLLDGAATRQAVIDGFRRHLAQAGPDGTAIFYFSGHGLRLDGNPGWADDERDGRDEAIYLWGAGDAGAVLLDDELGLLADDLGAAQTVLILDACFSGTGARGPVRTKAVDLADAALASEPTWLTAGRQPPATERYALLAASSDTEEALAGMPGEPSLFTSVLAPALRAAPDGTSLADLVASVRPRVRQQARRWSHRQTPQAEGRADATLGSLRR